MENALKQFKVFITYQDVWDNYQTEKVEFTESAKNKAEAVIKAVKNHGIDEPGTYYWIDKVIEIFS